MLEYIGMEWWKTLFNKDYLDTYDDVTGTEVTKLQVDFLMPFVRKEDYILDLACGQGRHTNELWERGYTVVGLDYSYELLKEARKGQGLFKHGDMRNLPFHDATFDTVFCMMSSFGYFENEEDHQRVVDEVYRVLKPGGTFVLDLKSPHYNHEGESVDTLSNGLVVKTIDRKEGNRWVTTRSWGEKEYTSSMRVFTKDEAKNLLSKFYKVNSFGSYRHLPFAETSKRMLLVAKK